MANNILTIADTDELTAELLVKYIKKHDQYAATVYTPLKNAYENDYKILHKTAKPSWKPDNRLTVNFARYIVDTFEGFFIGNPIKTTNPDEQAQGLINYIAQYNGQDDQDAQLSTYVSIYGRAYEIYYVDENGEQQIAPLDPVNSFAIYDNRIKPQIRYFVRTYTDELANGQKIRRGTVSNNSTVIYFDYVGGQVKITGEKVHGYGSVPAVEYIQNNSRRGIYQDVLPLIESYNNVLSEKADDVDYFSDAYLKVIGSELDEETIKFMRQNRVINFYGMESDKTVVDFLQKPSGDATQEHLLERMERLIYQIAMVCNISDDNFATSSGIALRYKLLPMINLAKTKERKMSASLDRRYKLLFSNATVTMPADKWIGTTYVYTPNLPANTTDEAATARSLSGMVSQKTQLAVLSSIVPDPEAELKQMEAEQTDEYNINRSDTPTEQTDSEN